MKKGVLLIDLQNDFFPSGALGVSGAQEIWPYVFAYLNEENYVIATQDTHPKNHISFASRHQKLPFTMLEIDRQTQELWPDHCIKGTEGWALHDLLKNKKIDLIFEKGNHSEKDSYSAFFENDKKTSTGLWEQIEKLKIKNWTILGLATDFCVQFTALDAVRLGLDVTVDLRGCRAVNCENLINVKKNFKANNIKIIQ